MSALPETVVVDAPRYRALTSTCDSLLLAESSSLGRVAVSWLHVLNEHPNNLLKYMGLFNGTRYEKTFRRDLANVARSGRTLARAFLAGQAPRGLDYRVPAFPKGVAVLLVSNLVSARAQAGDSDFYYGNLAKALAATGLTSLTVLQDQTNGDHGRLAMSLARGGNTARVVLPRVRSTTCEIRLARLARHAASSLRRAGSAASHGLARAVALEAAYQAGSEATISNLRLYEEIRQICGRLRPRAVIVLWEGHAWERICFAAARSVEPAVRCIAYQHAILFPRAHALARSLGKTYDPDLVLTVGSVTADALRKMAGLQQKRIVVYGSHRRAQTQPERAPDASARCLVVPDGIESECLKLFNFALQMATLRPDLQFVLRTHPILPFEELARVHVHLRQMPPNVRASNEPAISADLSRCDWVLYRGSSAAIHGVLAGARPIYLDIPNELRIDPMYALDGWRRYVSTASEFCAIVAADKGLSPEARASEWAPARDFCDRYVAPANPSVVAEAVG